MIQQQYLQQDPQTTKPVIQPQPNIQLGNLSLKSNENQNDLQNPIPYT